MAYDESLADRLRQALSRRRGYTERKMFGGIAFLLNGNVCVGVWKNSLIVRLGPERGTQALREANVRPFDITGRAMTGWILVEPAGIADQQDLLDWIDEAQRFVRTLPAKS
jgi:TfoX/Sxy family transcriptional regulator of competence genes